MSHVSLVGTSVVQASATTATVTVGATIPAGHTILGGVCWISAGAVPTISSLVDSRGNAWTTTPDVSVNNGSNEAAAIVRGTITTPLLNGDTITMTVSAAVTRWVTQYDEFDDIVVSSPLDVSQTNAPAASTSLTTNATASTTQYRELSYAAFGIGFGSETLTLGSGWSGTAYLFTTSGTNDRGLQVEYQYTAGLGPQTATCTASASHTYAACIGCYTTVSPLTAPLVISQAVKRAAFF